MTPSSNPQWLFIALIFFGIMAYIVWIRRQDRRWIEKRFGMDRVRMMSFGVNYFGCISEPGKPGRSSGFLLLTRDEVFFRSRIAGKKLSIPGRAIQSVYHDNAHKGEALHQSVMKIDFINARGNGDCAAFKVPYPPQWIAAVKSAFLT